MSKLEIFQVINDFLPLATLLTIAVSVWVITFQIRESRDVAKKLKALDLIVSTELAQLHEDGFGSIRTYKQNGDIAILGSKKVKDDHVSDRNNVLQLLNYYEYMAVAIKQNILCESTLRNSNYSTFLDLIDDCTPLISALRTNKKKTTLFVEAEWLANRWKESGYNGPLPPIEH